MQTDPAVPGDAEAVIDAHAGADPQAASEVSWTLESLEADIAAVGSAMETVDRIVAGVASGEGSVGSAASEIAAVVSQDRFGAPGNPPA